MEAKVVQHAPMAPAKCAVSGDIDGPFIDTGVWVRHHDPYLYLHVPVVEYWARELLEMVPKADVDAIREQFEAQTERIKELERFVEAHQVFAEAAEELQDQPETSTAGTIEVAA